MIFFFFFRCCVQLQLLSTEKSFLDRYESTETDVTWSLTCNENLPSKKLDITEANASVLLYIYVYLKQFGSGGQANLFINLLHVSTFRSFLSV